MSIFLSDILKLYLFTPGRRAYVLRQVRKYAAEHKLRDLVQSIDQALAREERAATLESAWGAARVGREAKPREVDILIDRVLVMFEQIISHYIGDSDPDIAAAANDLHSTLFRARELITWSINDSRFARKRISWRSFGRGASMPG